MDFSNTPSPMDWSKSQQVEVAQSPNSDDGLGDRRLLLESMEARKDAGTKTASGGVSVENQGQVKLITLPQNWQEATAKSDSNILRSERFFHPVSESEIGVEKDQKSSARADDSKTSAQTDDSKNTRIVFFYSGRANLEADGNQFKKTLEAEPHKLSADEIKGLEKTLGDLADPESFKLTEAHTKDLNGKRVLDVKGVWLYDNKQYHGVLINGDGTGQVVQQIYLMSPERNFSKHDIQFEASCRSIRWR